jgi:hypothetical protein
MEDNIKTEFKENKMQSHGLESTGSGYGKVAGSCGYGNDPSGSIKTGEYLDYLTDFLFLKNDSAPWNYVHILINFLLGLITYKGLKCFSWGGES